jgi:peptide deformylase
MVCSPIHPDDPDIALEVADLAATLQEFRERTGFGWGISAPQIVITKGLIILDLGAGPTALINPEITRRTRADRTPHSVIRRRINGPTVARPHQI